MTDAYADTAPASGGGWRTTLYEPLYPGSAVSLPTVGPITEDTGGFEGSAEWLREQGYDVTSWSPRPSGGFRAELREL